MADDTATAAIRRKLNITWSDPATDARLADIIATVTPALNRAVGVAPTTAIDPTDGETFGLFVNACFYEWSDALDEFWVNYLDDVSRVRARNVVAAYAAAQANA